MSWSNDHHGSWMPSAHNFEGAQQQRLFPVHCASRHNYWASRRFLERATQTVNNGGLRWRRHVVFKVATDGDPIFWRADIEQTLTIFFGLGKIQIDLLEHSA